MLKIMVLLEVEMNNVTAIQALFAQNAPVGADFEGAFNALKGKKDNDLSTADISTLDELAETFQDFAGEPAGWLRKASVADPRHSWWVQLAKALGASISSSSAESTPSTSSTESPVDSPVCDIEPEQGIDADELGGGAPPPDRRQADRGTGKKGITIRTKDDGDGGGDPPTPKKEPKEPDRGADRKKPKPHGDGTPTKDKPSDEESKSKADTAQVASIPDLVHGFQAGEDGGRLLRELIRELVATEKPERKATRQRRLDAEEQERQRRLTADTAERLRRMSEEEVAHQRRLEIEADDLRRRLEIEAKANEEKRLADLRVAAEKQRLADEADARKRVADEEAEERKLKRREAADARKRDADEANRLARKVQEEKEAAEKTAASRPKSLNDVTDRSIPAITRKILVNDSYCTWRVWLIEAFRLIRTGTSDERTSKREELPHMRNLINSMKASGDRMEIQAGYYLERLLEVLESGRDQREPDWFQATYVTGTYTD